MDQLTRAPERVLIDCLRAIDEGAAPTDCSARFPAQTEDIGAILNTRAHLLALRTTTPSPATFAAGREAMLARLVGSHAGVQESRRSSSWRPATRTAFAGALLFAMASCAIGVSATPVSDTIDQALPDVPTIDMPEQRPIYPFPEFNDAPPGMLPTEEPEYNTPAEPPSSQPEAGPDTQPVEAPDAGEPPRDSGDSPPAKPSSSNASWLPPINANEDEPVDDQPAAETTGPDVDRHEDPDDDRADKGHDESNANRDSSIADRDAGSSDIGKAEY